MPKRRRIPQPERHARNQDLTDREMLFNIQRAASDDGWATTTDIAIACGFTGNGKYRTPAVKVASRLVAMRRGDILESTGPEPGTAPSNEPGARDTRWRPTTIGETILAGKLSKAVLNALAKMDPGASVLVTGQIARQAYVEGDLGEAFAIRREFQHHLSKRKLVYLDRYH